MKLYQITTDVSGATEAGQEPHKPLCVGAVATSATEARTLIVDALTSQGYGFVSPGRITFSCAAGVLPFGWVGTYGLA